MTERRKTIVVIAVSAAAVLIVAVGAAALGGLLDGDDETVAVPESSPEPTEPEGDEEGEDDAEGDDAESGDDVNGEASLAGGDVLPEPLGGQEAIDALGEDLAAVAQKNGKTEEELRDLLLRDKTVKISPSGRLFYEDTATPHDD
ncbi:hypothetical protein EF847_01135 [Actinobacteria bacterium YIM 96077]|uniref:Uncharacterized protein n=1 Tax=Phytoactinopolyspora halophila TaxID=1981511 RepID=A0A329R1B4_9ACTN|nr:hypothetical protein [Phytoactinopolyspora halophila]AYY11530.1 hypothetical protein EF847_01135 [Actinobacteria bacterium YIM 96077]RAW17986.1 hypothetical protein DPM12_03870 [Phytoactinopolyspora halophila]